DLGQRGLGKGPVDVAEGAGAGPRQVDRAQTVTEGGWAKPTFQLLQSRSAAGGRTAASCPRDSTAAPVRRPCRKDLAEESHSFPPCEFSESEMGACPGRRGPLRIPPSRNDEI